MPEIDPRYDNYVNDEGVHVYPPDWADRRNKVLLKDENRCQVTGCLSLSTLEIHHIVPLSDGGSNQIDNLVSLCQVHHWLLPEHELVARRCVCKRFTMRRAHRRRSLCRTYYQNVSATFTRRVPASIKDCEIIRDLYGLQCKECDSEGIHFKIIDEKIVSICLGCRQTWSSTLLLVEEFGPLLANLYNAQQNIGRFQFDLSLLSVNPIKNETACIKCADRAEMGIMQKKSGRNGSFLGCSNYWSKNCKSTINC